MPLSSLFSIFNRGNRDGRPPSTSANAPQSSGPSTDEAQATSNAPNPLFDGSHSFTPINASRRFETGLTQSSQSNSQVEKEASPRGNPHPRSRSGSRSSPAAESTMQMPDSTKVSRKRKRQSAAFSSPGEPILITSDEEPRFGNEGGSLKRQKTASKSNEQRNGRSQVSYPLKDITSRFTPPEDTSTPQAPPQASSRKSKKHPGSAAKVKPACERCRKLKRRCEHNVESFDTTAVTNAEPTSSSFVQTSSGGSNGPAAESVTRETVSAKTLGEDNLSSSVKKIAKDGVTKSLTGLTSLTKLPEQEKASLAASELAYAGKLKSTSITRVIAKTSETSSHAGNEILNEDQSPAENHSTAKERIRKRQTQGRTKASRKRAQKPVGRDGPDHDEVVEEDQLSDTSSLPSLSDRIKSLSESLDDCCVSFLGCGLRLEAYALRRLYDQSRTNEDCLNLLEVLVVGANIARISSKADYESVIRSLEPEQQLAWKDQLSEAQELSNDVAVVVPKPSPKKGFEFQDLSSDEATKSTPPRKASASSAGEQDSDHSAAMHRRSSDRPKRLASKRANKQISADPFPGFEEALQDTRDTSEALSDPNALSQLPASQLISSQSPLAARSKAPMTIDSSNNLPITASSADRLALLPKGALINPACDRCRKQNLECRKYFTTCIECNKRHRKCTWIQIDEERASPEPLRHDSEAAPGLKDVNVASQREAGEKAVVEPQLSSTSYVGEAQLDDQHGSKILKKLDSSEDGAGAISTHSPDAEPTKMNDSTGMSTLVKDQAQNGLAGITSNDHPQADVVPPQIPDWSNSGHYPSRPKVIAETQDSTQSKDQQVIDNAPRKPSFSLNDERSHENVSRPQAAPADLPQFGSTKTESQASPDVYSGEASQPTAMLSAPRMASADETVPNPPTPVRHPVTTSEMLSEPSPTSKTPALPSTILADRNDVIDTFLKSTRRSDDEAETEENQLYRVDLVGSPPRLTARQDSATPSVSSRSSFVSDDLPAPHGEIPAVEQARNLEDRGSEEPDAPDLNSSTPKATTRLPGDSVPVIAQSPLRKPEPGPVDETPVMHDSPKKSKKRSRDQKTAKQPTSSEASAKNVEESQTSPSSGKSKKARKEAPEPEVQTESASNGVTQSEKPVISTSSAPAEPKQKQPRPDKLSHKQRQALRMKKRKSQKRAVNTTAQPAVSNAKLSGQKSLPSSSLPKAISPAASNASASTKPSLKVHSDSKRDKAAQESHQSRKALKRARRIERQRRQQRELDAEEVAERERKEAKIAKKERKAAKAARKARKAERAGKDEEVDEGRDEGMGQASAGREGSVEL